MLNFMILYQWNKKYTRHKKEKEKEFMNKKHKRKGKKWQPF